MQYSANENGKRRIPCSNSTLWQSVDFPLRSQARRLDKYLYRKSRQAAGKIGINDSDLRKSAARNRVTYLEKVKES